MNYKIGIIPHSTQRYNTVGDYWLHSFELDIRVSDFTEVTRTDFGRVGNEEVQLAEKYEFLVTIHELVEAYLCWKAKIPFEVIDKFDMEYDGPGEPGDAEGCPYKQQHAIATEVERRLAEITGVHWDQYDAAVNKLIHVREERENNNETNPMSRL